MTSTSNALRFTLKASAAAVLAWASLSVQAVVAPPVAVSPGDGQTTLGGIAVATGSVDLNQPMNVAGGEFNLSFDGNALEFLPGASSFDGYSITAIQSITADPLFTLAGGSAVFNFAPGVVGISLIFPAPVPYPAEHLPTVLSFKGLVLGQHQVTYDIKLFDDSFIEYGGTGSFNVTVMPVPEPATYGLMALGVAGLLLRRRRQA